MVGLLREQFGEAKTIRVACASLGNCLFIHFELKQVWFLFKIKLPLAFKPGATLIVCGEGGIRTRGTG